MTPEELEQKLNALLTASEIQADLLASIMTHLANVQAGLESALSGQREILSKMGVPKEQTAKQHAAAHNAALIVELEQLKPLLERLGKSKEEGGPAPSADRN
jgi:hypothetical protein